MCLGFVRNYAGFIAVRAILGVTEGGLLPGMVSGIRICFHIARNGTWMLRCVFLGVKVLYLSFFYKRSEMALRIGLFYTAASLSGAFGGMYSGLFFLRGIVMFILIRLLKGYIQDFLRVVWLRSLPGEVWRDGAGFSLSRV